MNAMQTYKNHCKTDYFFVFCATMRIAEQELIALVTLLQRIQCDS